MRGTAFLLGAGLGLAPLTAMAAGAVSVERGAQVAVTGGCHDCHTAGYNESGGKVDPAAALKGVPLGWQGPWGTTYAKNLRIVAAEQSPEDAFVKYAKSFQALPPMPYYNVHAMDESDIRSLYQYIVSLGEPGDAMPETVPPGQEPTTPYLVMTPVMPKK